MEDVAAQQQSHELDAAKLSELLQLQQQLQEQQQEQQWLVHQLSLQQQQSHPPYIQLQGQQQEKGDEEEGEVVPNRTTAAAQAQTLQGTPPSSGKAKKRSKQVTKSARPPASDTKRSNGGLTNNTSSQGGSAPTWTTSSSGITSSAQSIDNSSKDGKKAYRVPMTTKRTPSKVQYGRGTQPLLPIASTINPALVRPVPTALASVSSSPATATGAAGTATGANTSTPREGCSCSRLILRLLTLSMLICLAFTLFVECHRLFPQLHTNLLSTVSNAAVTAYNVMDLGVMETTSETTAEVTSEAEAGTALDETDKHDTSERDSNSHVGESEEVEEEQCEDSATWSTEVTATWQTFLDCSFFTENRKYCKQYEEATVHCPKACKVKPCPKQQTARVSGTSMDSSAPLATDALLQNTTFTDHGSRTTAESTSLHASASTDNNSIAKENVRSTSDVKEFGAVAQEKKPWWANVATNDNLEETAERGDGEREIQPGKLNGEASRGPAREREELEGTTVRTTAAASTPASSTPSLTGQRLASSAPSTTTSSSVSDVPAVNVLPGSLTGAQKERHREGEKEAMVSAHACIDSASFQTTVGDATVGCDYMASNPSLCGLIKTASAHCPLACATCDSNSLIHTGTTDKASSRTQEQALTATPVKNSALHTDSAMASSAATEPKPRLSAMAQEEDGDVSGTALAAATAKPTITTTTQIKPIVATGPRVSGTIEPDEAGPSSYSSTTGSVIVIKPKVNHTTSSTASCEDSLTFITSMGGGMVSCNFFEKYPGLCVDLPIVQRQCPKSCNSTACHGPGAGKRKPGRIFGHRSNQEAAGTIQEAPCEDDDDWQIEVLGNRIGCREFKVNQKYCKKFHDAIMRCPVACEACALKRLFEKRP